jgi:hypothetical protein
VKTVTVGAPSNAPVAVVPFTDAIYRSCADAPDTSRGCQLVGGVNHRYGIGQLEVTVKQWVAFLNTVDPGGPRSASPLRPDPKLVGVAEVRPDQHVV